LILGLNVLDVLLTVMILDSKGWEWNPIVRSVIEAHGDRFWIWKFSIVSVSLILLCLHSKFKPVRTIIVALCSIYLLVILYQVFLLHL
jgi:Ca2+/Na+ antiporter